MKANTWYRVTKDTLWFYKDEYVLCLEDNEVARCISQFYYELENCIFKSNKQIIQNCTTNFLADNEVEEVE